jgi:hypothetical protein
MRKAGAVAFGTHLIGSMAEIFSTYASSFFWPSWETGESHEPGVMGAPRLERKRADPVLDPCQHRGHGSPVAEAGCGNAFAIYAR